jgi:phenylalanyl-tRNA synthetase alpha chain
MDDLKAELLAAVEAAADLAALDEIRVAALGKKGRITEAMKALGALAPDARKARGQALNEVKDAVAAAVETRRVTLARAALALRLEAERVDVTLPTRAERTGHLHPISQTVDEIVAIFADMGFALAEGPDVEDDFHNFTALNFPPGHPARDMHDTFYLPDRADGSRMLLRTHTSPVQVRSMRTMTPPIRVICPGRTFRSDYDMTHTPMFHQVEGLVIDETTTMAHLKGCLMEFCRTFFDVDDLPLRFRPSFFPFTEPSAEVDIGCSRKGGELKLGNHGDWLEILGCGMVHPNVLSACGIDPQKYQGFAFGMGIERIAMLKYGIPDLRTFFEADLRWLRHYGFLPLDMPSLARGLVG